jgi:hypothetical protein
VENIDDRNKIAGCIDDPSGFRATLAEALAAYRAELDLIFRAAFGEEGSAVDEGVRPVDAEMADFCFRFMRERGFPVTPPPP